jgi:hydrogenase maturation factor HypF (carbamoyltransferase family)
MPQHQTNDPLTRDLKNKVKNQDIAYRFHLSLAELLVKTVLQLQQSYTFDTVVLSGGVFSVLTPFLFSFKKGYKSDNALLLFIFSLPSDANC